MDRGAGQAGKPDRGSGVAQAVRLSDGLPLRVSRSQSSRNRLSMHPEEQAHREAVHANPQADEPRLALAAWLEGRPENAQRRPG